MKVVLLFTSLSLPLPIHTENTTTVRFNRTTYTVSEAADLLSLEVEATATGTPPEMVEITISGFPDTNSSMNFNISSNGITLVNYTGFNDADLGSDRMFTLILSSSDDSVTLSTPNIASVTITEDDSKKLQPPPLSFSLPLFPSLYSPSLPISLLLVVSHFIQSHAPCP